MTCGIQILVPVVVMTNLIQNLMNQMTEYYNCGCYDPELTSPITHLPGSPGAQLPPSAGIPHSAN